MKRIIRNKSVPLSSQMEYYVGPKMQWIRRVIKRSSAADFQIRERSRCTELLRDGKVVSIFRGA